VKAAEGDRAEGTGKLLVVLRDAGQENSVSILLEQLCNSRSVFFIRDVANSLRDNGHDDAAASLLGKAQSALTA
jgi:hypothetical protein